MIQLQLLLGSRSYNLAVDSSDIDVYLVGSGSYLMPWGNKPHIMFGTKEEYMAKALLEYSEHPVYLQRLFPAEFLKDTDASKYILETREDVIKAQLQKVYNGHLNTGFSYLSRLDRAYSAQHKRLAYGTMFLDTVYRYAQGISFAEAIRPEGDFHQWLLDVRNGLISLEEAKAVSADKKQKAESVADFYNQEINQEFLDDWKSDMLILLDDKKEVNNNG